MGLFDKVKNILFEEEEVTEQIPVVKEEPVATKIERPLPKEEPKIEQPVVREQVAKPNVEEEKAIEIDMFSRASFRDDNFPFQDFDEEEFSNSYSRVQKEVPDQNPKQRATTNVLDYERKKRVEKRTDLNRLEKPERETNERKKFKPSPIISPVYGILNEDYRIEDIKNRYEVEESLTIEEVRKKAFEPTPKVDTTFEDTVTVKIEEPEEEKIQKVKTIDDLLEDTSDEIIDVSPSHDDSESIQYERENDNPEVEEKRFDEDDTLENDLFDLIDSMYEQRKDGDF